jgi:hypothetical protein
VRCGAAQGGLASNSKSKHGGFEALNWIDRARNEIAAQLHAPHASVIVRCQRGAHSVIVSPEWRFPRDFLGFQHSVFPPQTSSLRETYAYACFSEGDTGTCERQSLELAVELSNKLNMTCILIHACYPWADVPLFSTPIEFSPKERQVRGFRRCHLDVWMLNRRTRYELIVKTNSIICGWTN